MKGIIVFQPIKTHKTSFKKFLSYKMGVEFTLELPQNYCQSNKI